MIEDSNIKMKLRLLRLADQIGNASEACKIMGYSRDSFYRFRDRYKNGGVDALNEISRKKPNRKNRVSPEIEAAVIQFAFDYPDYGQQRAAEELEKTGIKLSPAGIRGIWMRNNLETFYKRNRALKERNKALNS